MCPGNYGKVKQAMKVVIKGRVRALTSAATLGESTKHNSSKDTQKSQPYHFLEAYVKMMKKVQTANSDWSDAYKRKMNDCLLTANSMMFLAAEYHKAGTKQPFWTKEPGTTVRDAIKQRFSEVRNRGASVPCNGLSAAPRCPTNRLFRDVFPFVFSPLSGKT